jgi:hypothetical protein
MRACRQTDMMKLIVAIRNFADAPKMFLLNVQILPNSEQKQHIYLFIFNLYLFLLFIYINIVTEQMYRITVRFPDGSEIFPICRQVQISSSSIPTPPTNPPRPSCDGYQV